MPADASTPVREKEIKHQSVQRHFECPGLHWLPPGSNGVVYLPVLDDFVGAFLPCPGVVR